MDEKTKKDSEQVYEIGYLISPSVPEDKILAEADILRGYVSGAGASIIAEDLPHREKLAYTMRKKTVSGTYEKCNEAYFGWVKFGTDSAKVEEIKKKFNTHQSMLRMLLISTVRENTFLGKRASAIAASLGEKPGMSEKQPEENKPTPVAPASIEEMDKSIDEMVKEAA